MIRLTEISKSFGDHKVLDHLSLHIREGEKICLVGGSGSGKSVLLKLILGLLSPDKGRVQIHLKDTSTFLPKDWHAFFQEIGVVFQGSALFDSLPVWENVGIRMRESHRYTVSEIQKAVVEALAQVNLAPEVIHQYPRQLSGGMQKRVAIARAIIHQPRLLIYDEPTTGLDPISADQIDQLIQAQCQQPDRTTLVVTHDMYTVQEIADRVILLHQGKLSFSGSTADFFGSDDPYIRRFLHRVNYG